MVSNSLHGSTAYTILFVKNVLLKIFKAMILKRNASTYTIDEITPDELEALYNAILHSLLSDRRDLYPLKKQIEDISKQ